MIDLERRVMERIEPLAATCFMFDIQYQTLMAMTLNDGPTCLAH